MSTSSLPAYPNPSVVRPDDASCDRDSWLLLRHLFLSGIVACLVVTVVFVLALKITKGGIVCFFAKLL
jgi:hypothetical protein